MIEKEIWIKIPNVEEAEKVRAFIWSLQDRFPGDCKVYIYNEECKSIKLLPNSHRLNADCHPVLINKFGEVNIKIKEEKIIPRNESERKIGTYEFMERIADSLEGINNQIERLNENLESVTGNFKGNAWINVSASVHEN